VALPWVRLDSNIGTHDKVLELLAMKDGHRAFTMYVCGLGYCGGHATDGLVPFNALPFLHGSQKHAELLVQVRLWDMDAKGWRVHNWDSRQELEVVTEAKQAGDRLGAAKGNCKRWHGPDCGCWKAST
jgi:hypothetical protein